MLHLGKKKKTHIFVLSFAMPPILVYKLTVHSTNTAILYYDVSNPLQTPTPWEQRWNYTRPIYHNHKSDEIVLVELHIYICFPLR